MREGFMAVTEEGKSFFCSLSNTREHSEKKTSHTANIFTQIFEG